MEVDCHVNARGRIASMKKISTRFALMMAVAAVVPLLAYGAVSIISTRDGSRRAVIQGNEDVARRVGEQIEQYVISHVRILKAIAASLVDRRRTSNCRSACSFS